LPDDLVERAVLFVLAFSGAGSRRMRWVLSSLSGKKLPLDLESPCDSDDNRPKLAEIAVDLSANARNTSSIGFRHNSFGQNPLMGRNRNKSRTRFSRYVVGARLRWQMRVARASPDPPIAEALVIDGPRDPNAAVSEGKEVNSSDHTLRFVQADRFEKRHLCSLWPIYRLKTTSKMVWCPHLSGSVLDRG
jgi:hypothetical protein